jgi:c-di-GMP-binding flagellar brake protein YcgR
VVLLAEFGGMHIEFSVANPQSIEHGGASAVRLAFPAVIVSHQQRAHPRAQVPSGFPLRCVMPVGEAAALHGQIMDISPGGFGLLLLATNITPGPGTTIKGCHIERPGENPTPVDLEVRHSRPVAFADGSRAQRWGCQFLDPSEKVKKLISLLATE